MSERLPPPPSFLELESCKNPLAAFAGVRLTAEHLTEIRCKKEPLVIEGENHQELASN
jgi:hypothetical protein